MSTSCYGDYTWKIALRGYDGSNYCHDIAFWYLSHFIVSGSDPLSDNKWQPQPPAEINCLHTISLNLPSPNCHIYSTAEFRPKLIGKSRSMRTGVVYGALWVAAPSYEDRLRQAWLFAYRENCHTYMAQFYIYTCKFRSICSTQPIYNVWKRTFYIFSKNIIF